MSSFILPVWFVSTSHRVYTVDSAILPPLVKELWLSFMYHYFTGKAFIILHFLFFVKFSSWIDFISDFYWMVIVIVEYHRHIYFNKEISCFLVSSYSGRERSERFCGSFGRGFSNSSTVLHALASISQSKYNNCQFDCIAQSSPRASNMSTWVKGWPSISCTDTHLFSSATQAVTTSSLPHTWANRIKVYSLSNDDSLGVAMTLHQNVSSPKRGSFWRRICWSSCIGKIIYTREPWALGTLSSSSPSWEVCDYSTSSEIWLSWGGFGCDLAYCSEK